MGKKKRPFIDRALARTYELVYRPRDDTREGPERVFKLVETSSRCRHRERAGDQIPDTRNDPLAYTPEVNEDTDEQLMLWEEWEKSYKGKEYELGEYGFEGGYDYSQHFKPIGNEGGVFISADGSGSSRQVEESDRISEMKKRDEEAKRRALKEIARDRRRCKELELVLNALDSDDDFELEEDDKGEAQKTDSETLENASVTGEAESPLEDDFINIADGDLVKIGRVEIAQQRKKRLIDEQFDKFMSEGYGMESDCESKDDDDEEEENDLTRGAFLVDGLIPRREKPPHGDSRSDVSAFTNESEDAADLNKEIDGIVDRFLHGNQSLSISDVFDNSVNVEGARAAIERAEKEMDSPEDGLSFTSEEDERERWDCETILTTYSNLSNHPRVIDDRGPRKRTKSRLGHRFQTPREDGRAMEANPGLSCNGRSAPVPVRAKGESKEEKKLRKKETKARARLRRQQKSELKKAFRKELNKQERHAAGMGTTKVAVRL